MMLHRKVGPNMLLAFMIVYGYIRMCCASTCPFETLAKCDCFDSDDSSIHTVNCTGKGFLEVPKKIPARTTHLYLDNNIISEIRNSSFDGGLPNLRTLSIRHNFLERIESASFTNMASLQILDLYNNSLQENNSLPSSVFGPIKESLKTLDIRRNLMKKDIDDINYPHSISSLTSLEELNIDCLENKSLPAAYSNLRNLQRLIFTGGRFKNQSKYQNMFISRDMFDAVAELNITEINLTGLGITFLDVNILAKLKNLQVLDLSNNPTIGSPKAPLPSILKTLNASSIKRLRLNNTDIRTQATDVINSLCNMKIIELTLDQNSIYDVEPILHKCIPDLQVLSIGDNYIYERSDFILDLYALNKLQGLNLSWQHREYNTREKRNTPSHICETGMACPIRLAADMKWVDMSHYGLHLPSIPEIVLLANTTLNYLNAAYTGIQVVKSGFYCPDSPMNITPQLVTMDFRGNSIQCITSIFFDSSVTNCNWDSLNYFYVGNNRLGIEELNICDKNKSDILGFIKPLRKLKVLDLSRNYIKFIRNDDFKDLSELKTLDLSFNNLAHWTLAIGHMVNIDVIRLSSNRIQCLPKNSTSQLDEIQEKRARSSIKIDLLENPLLCTCSCLQFYEWLKVTDVMVVNYVNYKCTFPNNEVWQLNNLNTILAKLYALCFGTLWLNLYISILLLLYCIITVCSMVYRMRHEIRYIWVKMRLNRDMIRRLLTKTKDQYRFDAFISCEHKDCNYFVKKHLLPALETENKGVTGPVLDTKREEEPDTAYIIKPSLSFCVAQRDFVLGMPIIDNIVRCMGDSRKVILIISQHSIKSGWCNEEMKMAHQESLDRGRNIIICILMPGIEEDKLPGTIKLIIKHVTCIEWPKDERAQKVFWLMLQKALLDGAKEELNTH